MLDRARVCEHEELCGQLGPAFRDSVATERPDVLVIPGGIVRLKGNENLSITGLGLQSGHVLACMAETLLMGLEEMTSHGSYGAISPEQVDRMMALADKHDFVLADIDYGENTV